MSEEYLEHYGTPRHSGRYPWGSGENPYQHGPMKSVRMQKAALKKQGYKTDAEIAKKLGMSINDMKAAISQEKAKEMAYSIAQANKLKNKGYGATEIAKKMSTNGRTVSERQVRYWLKDADTEKRAKADATKTYLKELVDKKECIDVGSGTEISLGINSNRFKTSLRQLKDEGYELLDIRVKSATDPNKFTHTTVLAKPGTQWADIQNHQEKIKTITDYSSDGGKTVNPIQYPSSISSNRVKIRYAEEGGKDFDGVILLRRGVEDLSLGKSNYAQVRIAVDGTHYLKGMAMYSDDIPKGYDIIFNTNKHVGTPKMDVLKPLKDDKDLPFGSVIKQNGQSYYKDPKGDYILSEGIYKKVRKGTHKGEDRYSLNAVNKLKEEGEWDTYTRSLSSQFLSKQHKNLIKQQLDLTYADKLAEYEEICKLSNPVVKKKLLESFADDCDASAVHLKASPLPGQNTKVILPVSNKIMPDDRIFAPGYDNGTKVALVRHPHAGTFEIPVLTVDNNNRKVRKILGNTPIDSVGITAKTAEKLSGADFDGDTVLVLPLRGRGTKIISRPSLKGLENFDPKEAYPQREGMHIMTDAEKGREMGKISNLITDMTLKGADDEKMARAVRHSMVVIDAKKHKLDYKRSYEENAIAALEKEFQPKDNGRSGGAATLISKSKSPYLIEEVKSDFAYRPASVSEKTGKRISGILPNGEKYYAPTGREYYTYSKKVPKIDPDTGKQVLTEKGKPVTKPKNITVYKDKEGHFYYNDYDKKGNKHKIIVDSSKVKVNKAMTKTTKMEAAKDARELSSGHVKEEYYANYANKMKALGNTARKEWLNTPDPKKNPSAADIYKPEVDSLNTKLKRAMANAPKERAANRIANQEISKFKKKYYDEGSEWDKDDLSKFSQKALYNARAKTGAEKKSVRIDITPKEWEAIQANAISPTTLKQILANTDEDKIRELATPKKSISLSPAEIGRIKTMQTAGFTTDEIVKALGRSASTVKKYLKD